MRFNQLIFIAFIILLGCNNSNPPKPVSSNDIEDFRPLFELIKSIVLIGVDDPLDPEVEAFMKYEPKPIWEDNAYIYLWGMDIKTDTPYKAGNQIIKSLIDADKRYQYPWCI